MDKSPEFFIKIPWWKMLFRKKCIRIPFKNKLEGPAIFDDNILAIIDDPVIKEGDPRYCDRAKQWYEKILLRDWR